MSIPYLHGNSGGISGKSSDDRERKRGSTHDLRKGWREKETAPGRDGEKVEKAKASAAAAYRN
jgi:hypothetical protein